MRKVFSVLMIGLLIGIAVSCGDGEVRHVGRAASKLLQKGLTIGLTIEKLTAELKQKGLTVEKREDLVPEEYLIGLHKLSQLQEEKIKRVKEFNITIVVGDRFKKEVSTESVGKLVIDYWASKNKIKNFILEYAWDAYDAHLRESQAYENSKMIIESLSSKGINVLGKTDSINWRKCLDGLVKLSFISEVIPGNKIGKDKIGRKVKIWIGTIWHKHYIGGEIEQEIDYELSLEEIYSYILRYL